MSGRHRKLPPSRHRQQRGRHRKPPSRSLTVLPTVTVVALLAVGGVGLGHAVARDQPHAAAVGITGAALPSPVVAVTATSQVIVPASPPPPPTPSPIPSHSPKRPPPPAVHHSRRHRTATALTVTDLGPACYVQVTTKHGRLLVRRILHGHQHLKFRGHGLQVVLGNAGGVRISLHGGHAHRAGRSGQVLRFRVR